MAISAVWLTSASLAWAQAASTLCERAVGWTLEAPTRSLDEAKARNRSVEQQLDRFADKALDVHNRRLKLSEDLWQAYPEWFQAQPQCKVNARASAACRRGPSAAARQLHATTLSNLEQEFGVAVYEYYAASLEASASTGTALFLAELGDAETYNPRRDLDDILRRQAIRLEPLRTGNIYWFNRRGVFQTTSAREIYDTLELENQVAAQEAIACSRRAQIDANWNRVEQAMRIASQSGADSIARMEVITTAFLPSAVSPAATVAITAERRQALELPLFRARNERLMAEEAQARAAYRLAQQQAAERDAAARAAAAAQREITLARLGLASGVNSLPGGDIRGARALIPCNSAAFPFENGRRRHYEVVRPGRQGSTQDDVFLQVMSLVSTVTIDGEAMPELTFYPTHNHQIERYGECDYLLRHDRTIKNTTTLFGHGGGEIMRFHRMWNGAYAVARESVSTGETHYELMRWRHGNWEFVNLPCSGPTGFFSQFLGMRFVDGRCYADTLAILVTSLSMRTNDRPRPTTLWLP